MSVTKTPKYYGLIGLDKLLTSQNIPMGELGADESPSHHEMFFIIIHQVYELWFKAINHELDSVLKTFRDNPKGINDEREIGVIVGTLNRVIEILKLLVAQIRVMETLTPLDFLDFRDRLGNASGHDSLQFRMIEAKLGLKLTRGRATKFKVDPSKHKGIPFAQKHIKELLAADKDDESLFDYVEAWLERTPFVSRKEEPGRWFAKSFKALPGVGQVFKKGEYRRFLRQINKESGKDRNGLSHDAFLAALFIHLYRDEPILQNPHRLLENLKEIDELFSVWRAWHSSMVLRMIGGKPGTGGLGYEYLVKTKTSKVFPELARISTYMIPRKVLRDRPIPPKVLDEMERLLFGYRRNRSN